MKHRGIWIITILIVVAVLAGEIITYTSNTDKYRFDVSYSGSGIDYSLSISGSQVYSVVSTDNGKRPMEMIYIYYDENYKSNYESELGPIGSHPLNQEYYLDQLVLSLNNMGAPPLNIVSAKDLKTAMLSDISDDFQKGLVVISGALPDTIYHGETTDLVFKWLEKGGRMYWLGNLIGAFYATPTDIVPVNDYQRLFFGTECLNTGDVNFASEDANDGGMNLRYLLSLKNNRVKYGVDVSKIAHANTLGIGYSEDDYSSIVFVGYGKGTLCILAGDYSRNQRSDLVLLISSGITERTVVLGTESGSIINGTVFGNIPAQTTAVNNISTYIYLGGYYPTYGKFFPGS